MIRYSHIRFAVGREVQDPALAISKDHVRVGFTAPYTITREGEVVTIALNGVAVDAPFSSVLSAIRVPEIVEIPVLPVADIVAPKAKRSPK